MRGQSADLWSLGLNALDPDTEADCADFLSEDRQGVAALDGQVDKVRTTIGKDRETQPIAIMQGLAAHQEHRGEEIPHPGKLGKGPGLFLPRETMTGKERSPIPASTPESIRAEVGVAQIIALGDLLIHVKPRGNLPLRPCFTDVLGLIVPKLADEAVGTAFSRDPSSRSDRIT